MSWGLVVVGIGTAIGGAATAYSAKSASSTAKKLAGAGAATPEIDPSEGVAAYFRDLEKYGPQAESLARGVAKSDLAVQESMLPGIGKERAQWFEALAPLLRGELPKGTLDAFMRSGAASSVGSGFGGSGFGFVNQGLFGARGSLGAMQQGYGLLGALMSTLPQSPSASSFLSQITTPGNRSSIASTTRGQNLGLATSVAGLPTSGAIWGGFGQQAGGNLVGIGTQKLLNQQGQGAGGAGYNSPGATGWIDANFPAGTT